MKTEKITVEELATELTKKFASWVGTPSEELLEDGGAVIDHLSDVGEKWDRDELEAIPIAIWDAAWEAFDATTKRY